MCACRLDSQLVRQQSTTEEPHFDSGMGSSSEDSASTRPSLLKDTSAESSDISSESVTTGSSIDMTSVSTGAPRKDDVESDLDLEYDEEETVEGSSNSVLLVVEYVRAPRLPHLSSVQLTSDPLVSFSVRTTKSWR